jgi:hypothetical protein
MLKTTGFDWKNLSSRVVLRLAFTMAFAMLLALPAFAAGPQNGDDDKTVDIRTPVGDAHVGSDVDARQVGLPIYPGARLRRNKDNDGNNSANLGLFTSAFGIKVVAANYDSEAQPDQLIAYYREKLKKYGKVLECHTSKHGVHMDAGDDDSNAPESKDKSLKCEGDNTGDSIELKVGTEDNQHIVAIEHAESGKGSTFALVYVHVRGKQADI